MDYTTLNKVAQVLPLDNNEYEITSTNGDQQIFGGDLLEVSMDIANVCMTVKIRESEIKG